MEHAKERFQAFLLEVGAKPSTLLSKEKFDLIRRYLLQEADDIASARFRQYVKEKRFQLKDYGSYGLTQLLVTPVSKPEKANINSLFGGFRRVVHCDEMFDVIQSVHEKGSGHSGVQKTFEMVSRNYDGIPRSCVREYCKLCPTCACKKPQLTKAPLKPIITKCFHLRGQVDLVDMRSCSDGAYNWIGHYKDHFSKFSILWAQRRKCAQETIDCIERFVFAYLGVPKILQSDNGRKFDNEIFHQMVKQWSQQAIVIRGRPRHPQSNGCVEQANGTMKHMLQSLMCQLKTKEWVKLIPRIQFTMNTQNHATLKTTPYNVVFGIDPSSEPVSGIILAEEDSDGQNSASEEDDFGDKAINGNDSDIDASDDPKTVTAVDPETIKVGM
ncbi:KRAB-A domain-containing protein 2-like [Dysidea avara]|uniref:KRAB-A domain-containing protein 2-like n=1 Tax=Dysidea avara TaxID=196820 RepID=UPI003329C85C